MTQKNYDYFLKYVLRVDSRDQETEELIADLQGRRDRSRFRATAIASLSLGCIAFVVLLLLSFPFILAALVLLTASLAWYYFIDRHWEIERYLAHSHQEARLNNTRPTKENLMRLVAKMQDDEGLVLSIRGLKKQGKELSDRDVHQLCVEVERQQGLMADRAAYESFRAIVNPPGQ